MIETPQTPWLRVIPLGGLGHIGGNMMVYETADDLIVVDCGVLFPTVEEPGIDYVVPDIGYIIERRDKFRGIVLTHGHEDHIGALPFLLPLLGHTRLFATRFTAALVTNKLAEHPSLAYELVTMLDRKPFALGKFTIEALAVTHSIPDAVGLAIDSEVGTIVHTGDFKIDPTPIDGRLTDEAGFVALGERGVALLCSDSTNSLKPGRTWSERAVHQAIGEVVSGAKGRVFVTTFASHIDRIQAVCDAAANSGRKVMPCGRSMRNNIGIARALGILKAKQELFVAPDAFGRLKAAELVVLASGSQGEPQSAMARIARGKFPPIELDAGDLVVFSSRRIPGNERAISDMTNALVREGATIVGDHEARVHSSGHAFADEQADMIRWCKPKAMLPVHGELRHLVAHGRLAASLGVKQDHVFVHEDGTPLLLELQGGSLRCRREAKVQAGLVFVDGKGIGDVGEMVLRERKWLGESGVIVCVLVLTSHGTLAVPPHLAVRGTFDVAIYPEMVKEAATKLERELRAHERVTSDEFRDEAKATLRRFFKQALARQPIIVPVVLTLPASCCD